MRLCDVIAVEVLWEAAWLLGPRSGEPQLGSENPRKHWRGIVRPHKKLSYVPYMTYMILPFWCILSFHQFHGALVVCERMQCMQCCSVGHN